MDRRSLNPYEDGSPLVSIPLSVPAAGRSFAFSPASTATVRLRSGRATGLGGLARAASAQDRDRFVSIPHRSAQLSSFLSSLSPDPPARGPADMANAAQRILELSSRRTSAPPVASSASGATGSRTRQRAAARPAPDTLSSTAYAAAISDDAPASRRPRRSTRSKRQASAAARAANDAPSDFDAAAAPSGKRQKRGSLKRAPAALKDDSAEFAEPEPSGDVTASCCICMDEPKPADLAKISACDHLFCFECIEKWAERENTCPLCKVRFSKIDRVNKAKKGGDKAKNSKRVKQRDQRSDLAPGAALEGLLASFAASAPFPPNRVARLIFSGFSGNPFFVSSARIGGETSDRARIRPGPRASVNPGAAAFLSSTDNSDADDDDVTPVSGLFRSIPTRGVYFESGVSYGASMQVLGPMQFGSAGLRQPAGRSYASNSNDQNAGSNSSNPLEIDDSDSDDDIEVVQVRRARA